MSILVDTQLRDKLNKIPSELIDTTLSSVPPEFRGCSIDLHIGAIYRPGVISGGEGSASNPHRLPVCLKEGETALIETVESFKLDSKHAAFVFPSSRVSIQGLLMTNPGHVDPGYSGRLHVTVINMGREPFSLQPGNRFLRAFIHELDTGSVTPPPVSPPVTQELLNKLTPDFLSVSSRAESAAKKEVDRAVLRSQWLQLTLPVIATIFAALITYFSAASRFEERIKVLEAASAAERIKTLELSYPLQKRLIDIESRLEQQSHTTESINSSSTSKLPQGSQSKSINPRGANKK